MKLTPKQARERIDEVKEIIKAKHMCESMDGECSKEDIQDYRERFEALQMGADALALQEPKKPIIPIPNSDTARMCPNCGEILCFIDHSNLPKYCSECGQKIEESDN